MQNTQAKFPPPPGLLASLMAGFDSVASHIALILPPVLLDLFLWFGPRLHLKSFLQPLIDSLPSLAEAFPSTFTGMTSVQVLQETWTSIANDFNLGFLLRTYPVGVSSLLSLQMPPKNPVGAPLSMDAGSLAGILGWVLLLVFIGWLAGAMYYFWVSNAALKPDTSSLSRALAQVVFLSLIWLAVLVIIGLPVLLVVSILTALSPLLGQVALFACAVLLIWMVMPVFFSAHGIFTFQQDAFAAILASLRMVRFTLPNTGLFLLAFIVLNQGLNFLWNTPAYDSWWLLVGIAGHAFVSTALLAASFVYYRDINGWMKTVFEILKQQTTSVKA